MYAMTESSDGLPPSTDYDSLLDGRFAGSDEVADGDNPIASGWEFHSLKDAYQPRPPIVEIVSQVAIEASLNIWYGAPGSKKSMILADVCSCIVAGRTWLEHLPSARTQQSTFPTIAGAAMWLDFDNGTRRTHDRFAAFGRAYGLPEDAPLSYISMPSPWLDISSLRMVSALASIIERQKIIFLVVDNLGVVIGDAEENTGDMAPVMANLRWLCNSTGVSLNIIHHQRKSSSTTSDTALGRAESLRGHSSILGSLDQAYHVEAIQDEDRVVVTPAKQRDYSSFESLSALFTYEHHEGTRTLHTARFWGTDGSTKATREIDLIRAAILGHVSSHPGASQQEIVSDARDGLSLDGKPPGVNRIRGVLKLMVDKREIVVRVGERTANRARIEHFKA